MDSGESENTWIFHPNSFSLTSPSGQTVKFSASESAIFHELVVSGGLLPLHKLIQRFGEIDASEEMNKVRFEKIISRIRLKLKPYTQEDTAIQSVYKQGYQLMLPVSVSKN
jgi:DNA-binding winged helix-turn-helix (wHTH) protein